MLTFKWFIMLTQFNFSKLLSNKTWKQLYITTAGLQRNDISIEEAVQHLKRCKKVIVMAGAGLSTSSGIPDFRSPDTGLYYKLEQYNLPYPEAIFDISYFENNPQPFLTLARELYPGGKYHPNVGHYFACLLHQKGKLLRMYTQNIDGLERLSGMPPEKLVEAHGGFYTASCIKCTKKQDPDRTKDQIMKGEIVYCDSSSCQGLVKPDIVFFNERLPERFLLYQEDVLVADFLIVVGTSLQVYPFASIAMEVSERIPRLLINREIVGSFGMRKKDTMMIGDISDNVTKLVKDLGWDKDLQILTKSSVMKLKK